MYKVGIISDTRIATPGQSLPARVKEAFAGVDLIIHAGNITKEFVLEELERVAPVVAVRGALDDPGDFKRDLPASRTLDVQGFKVAVHNQRPEIPALGAEKVHILVSGNTCTPGIRETEEVPLMLDPGSPTIASKHARGTVILLKIDKLVFSYIIKL
ncbi:MAG: metallophosphoesterase family protein [Candidatus Lokiarchaeota archaeon]|nr:metallophosphoesterase family protein [Candidatus Lokiarchaeota archaeon]